MRIGIRLRLRGGRWRRRGWKLNSKGRNKGCRRGMRARRARRKANSKCSSIGCRCNCCSSSCRCKGLVNRKYRGKSGGSSRDRGRGRQSSKARGRGSSSSIGHRWLNRKYRVSGGSSKCRPRSRHN